MSAGPASPRLTSGSSRAAFIPPGGPLSVERAFAEELRVSVPWSSLGADPLEVWTAFVFAQRRRKRMTACPSAGASSGCGCRPGCSRPSCLAATGSDWWPAATRRGRCCCVTAVVRQRRCGLELIAALRSGSSRVPSTDDEPLDGAAGWVVGALNGINCRLVDVSVALSYGNQQSVRVAVGLAHALTVADTSGSSPAELSVEQLCKEMLLERVRVELSHSGANGCL